MFRFRVVRGDPEDIGGSGIPGTEEQNGGALLYGGPKRTELPIVPNYPKTVPSDTAVLAQMAILHHLKVSNIILQTEVGSNGVTVTKFLSYFLSYIFIVVTVTEVTKVPKFLI